MGVRIFGNWFEQVVVERGEVCDTSLLYLLLYQDFSTCFREAFWRSDLLVSREMAAYEEH